MFPNSFFIIISFFILLSLATFLVCSVVLGKNLHEYHWIEIPDQNIDIEGNWYHNYYYVKMIET